MMRQWTEIITIMRGPLAGCRLVKMPPPALPRNARILVSRNKREGRYAGWSRDIHMDPVTYAVFCIGSRHQRENLYAGLNALRARRSA